MAEKFFEPTCCRSILSWKLCRKKVNVEVVILLRQWHKVCLPCHLAKWDFTAGQLSQIEGKSSEGRYLVNNHRSTPNTLDTNEHPAFRTNSEDWHSLVRLLCPHHRSVLRQGNHRPILIIVHELVSHPISGHRGIVEDLSLGPGSN